MRSFILLAATLAAVCAALTAGPAPAAHAPARRIGLLPCGLGTPTAAALRTVRGYRPAQLVEASIRGRARTRAGYDWPLAPFGREHEVRAYLNDPRIDPGSESFHFGIDLSGPAGLPVYAIEAGTVAFEEERSIAVIPSSGERVFTYWHLTPLVGPGQFVRRHQLIGRIAPGWNHVHLSERVARIYVNPLRPVGGIGPFSDSTAPAINDVTLWGASHSPVAPDAVSGRVDLVADVFDTAAGVTPTPWPVAPAIVRWRLWRGRTVIVPWQTALDFRRTQIPDREFDAFYAPGTRQNRPGHPGRYCYYLARGWDSTELADGSYRLEVLAGDIHGNRRIASLALTIAN